MEGMRGVASAHYETLPEEAKAEIHNEFKKVENEGISEYVKSRSKFESEIWEQCLEGYKKEEGNVDLKDFITLKYILENTIVTCDGCSSLLMGRAFFSCEECFFNYPSKSYDLCGDCYRTRKFEDHNHHNFLNNLTLQYRSRRRRFDEVKSQLEKRNKSIEEATRQFASAFMEFIDLIQNDKKLEAMPYDPEETHRETNFTENFGPISTPPMSPRPAAGGSFSRLNLVRPTPSYRPYKNHKNNDSGRHSDDDKKLEAMPYDPEETHRETNFTENFGPISTPPMSPRPAAGGSFSRLNLVRPTPSYRPYKNHKNNDSGRHSDDDKKLSSSF